jgi:hypothetical protein
VKSRDVLRVLLEAAEQAPATPKVSAAVARARRSLKTTAPTVQDYQLLLANSGRALECIAEGFAWAAQMRANGVPVEKVSLVVSEQNRKAAALLLA